MDVPEVENEFFTADIEKSIRDDKDLSGEEKEKIIAEQKSFPMSTNTLAYTQDGKELLIDWEYAGYAYMPVHNADIKKLKVFVFGEKDAQDQGSSEDYMQMKKEGLNSPAAQKAQIAAEIDVK